MSNLRRVHIHSVCIQFRHLATYFAKSLIHFSRGNQCARQNEWNIPLVTPIYCWKSLFKLSVIGLIKSFWRFFYSLILVRTVWSLDMWLISSYFVELYSSEWKYYWQYARRNQVKLFGSDLEIFENSTLTDSGRVWNEIDTAQEKISLDFIKSIVIMKLAQLKGKDFHNWVEVRENILFGFYSYYKSKLISFVWAFLLIISS